MNFISGRKIFITVPLMDEEQNILPLVNCLKSQSNQNFKVIFCVNQPEVWWDDNNKKGICEANLRTIKTLNEITDFELQIIDRCSPGHGWVGKHFGVGWARKIAMDEASNQAEEKDMIVSMDGDSHYNINFLACVEASFVANPNIKAVSVPYFHKLTGSKAEDMAILRYEIYMRYYALNMLRINNPYAFTALGSAIACSINAYRAIRGITPHKSGEDFYFIQKLRKYGQILIYLDETVFPAARFSDRVFFGTGPAMIKGNAGDWEGYPIYPYQDFEEVKISFDNFDKLYEKDIEIPMTEFLFEKFGADVWDELRKNVKSKQNFIRACWHKVDGLRILQFLKWKQQKYPGKDEENLNCFLRNFYPNEKISNSFDTEIFTFEKANVGQLEFIRDFLMEKEMLWRKKIRILR